MTVFLHVIYFQHGRGIQGALWRGRALCQLKAKRRSDTGNVLTFATNFGGFVVFLRLAFAAERGSWLCRFLT